MKRFPALILALVLCAAALTGCGGGEASSPASSSGAASVSSSSSTASSTASTSSSEAAAESSSESSAPPAPTNAPKLVVVENIWLGCLTVSYMDDGSILCDTENYPEPMHVQSCGATISGAGFEMQIGTETYMEDSFAGYEAAKKDNDYYAPVTYGGITGFRCSDIGRSGIICLLFPATEPGNRSWQIAVYSEEAIGAYDTDMALELLDLPAVKAILDTLWIGAEAPVVESNPSASEEESSESETAIVRTLDDDFVTVPLTEVWKVLEESADSKSSRYWLNCDSPYGYITIYGSDDGDPESSRNLKAGAYTDISERTIGGIHWLVSLDEDGKGWIYTATSSGGVVQIQHDIPIDKLEPFLETLTIK